MRQSRSAARSRTVATSRVSVVTPGNRILRSTRRAVARSNKTLGRSALSHARVYSHCTSRKCSG